MPDKKLVHAVLVAEIEAKLATMAAIAEDTRRGATHEENRAEGDKDMRATEQSYVARGQAMRVEELADAATRLSRVAPAPLNADDGARLWCLVALAKGAKTTVYYLVRYGAGHDLLVDGVKITTLSDGSPLGESLMGLGVGDRLDNGAMILALV